MKLLNKIVRPLAFVAVAATAMFTTSCEDFLDVSSNTVIDANKDHLSSARDSIYSVIGVLNKMQAIADRTVLLGEARGDLVDITSSTSKDLRDLALFNAGDDNKYNSPREYYAIINNCNYFIAHVDTAMTNNRNENVFLNEYAVVKAVRAWTYLQLVTTYGRVPFVTTPILSKDEGEDSYPMYGIKEVCDYFINEDGLCDLADNPNVTYPWYGDIKGIPSRLFYIQMNLILGDLYLWRASLTNSKSDYLESAKRYYDYLSKRNGTTTSSAYPTSGGSVSWTNDSWDRGSDSWSTYLFDESNGANSEIISIIPMDSIKSEGYYSELRSIFCSDYNEEQKVGLVPSESLQDLSAAQEYCYFDNNSVKFSYAPKGLKNHMDGDLRLAACWYTNDNATNDKGERFTEQTILKFYYPKNGNISLYRRGQVYLRLAEAINRAGFPRFAYQILASGVNDQIINYCVTYFADEDDVETLSYFSFPQTRYNVAMWKSPIPGVQQMMYGTYDNSRYSIGIHSRGSGVSPFNEFYQMPYGEAIIDTIEVRNDNDELIGYEYNIHKDSETPGLVEKQMEAVEDMIVNEQALETAFEGYRFYDLMRVAYRRNDPSYLANKIYARRGADVTSDITTNLLDPNNWFLKWNGQIGMQ